MIKSFNQPTPIYFFISNILKNNFLLFLKLPSFDKVIPSIVKN